MKRKMEYHIISGRTIETRRCYLPASGETPRRRYPRKAGTSSIRKIAANERESVRRLARIINCNFSAGDMFLTLKYSNERLPGGLEDADIVIQKFLRKCRDEYRRQTGKKLRYILVTTDKSSHSPEPARIHHHIIMDRLSWETVIRYWPESEVKYEIMDNRGDHTALAKYIVDNSPKIPGRKKWSGSRGLNKPIFTEPVPVDDIDGILPPVGADIKENVILNDEELGVPSAYMRCVLPSAPEVHGNKVIIKRQIGPRRKKEAVV